MQSVIALRPARMEDYPFALQLYLATMKPYAAELMAWDDEKQAVSLANQWKMEDVEMILRGDRLIGWLQAKDMGSEIFLQQLYISPQHQRRGIGSTILGRLLDRWHVKR